MLEQRSEEWFNARLGRFTASEISKLMGVKGLGKTGESYAIEKAIESVAGKDDREIFSGDLKRGVELEPLAFKKFAENKFFDFLDVEETTFFEYGDHSGATPDGLVSDNSILEIKCPQLVKFYKIVADGEIDTVYEWQMQHQMLCADRENSYFFNYIIDKGIEYWHEIIVNRDEKKIDLIKSRLNEAIEIKLNYIEKINSNKQW